jgi:hypothetical protein
MKNVVLIVCSSPSGALFFAVVVLLESLRIDYLLMHFEATTDKVPGFDRARVI